MLFKATTCTMIMTAVAADGCGDVGKLFYIHYYTFKVCTCVCMTWIKYCMFFISFNLDYKYTHFFGKLYTRRESNNRLPLSNIAVSNIHSDLCYCHSPYFDIVLKETSNTNGVSNISLNRGHSSPRDLLGDREAKIIIAATSLNHCFKMTLVGEIEDKV